MFCATVKRKKTAVFKLGCTVTLIVLVCVWWRGFSTNTQNRVATYPHPTYSMNASYSDPMSLDIRSLTRNYVHKSSIDMTQTDPKACADPLTSVVKLSSEKKLFKLGETVGVDIHLFDSYKRRKTKGGDFVRVLIKEDSNNASAVGSVTDNNDGTYTGSVRALWTGSPQIEVEVVGPRESMEIFNRMYHDHTTLRSFTALFESGGINETTECLPVPQIPGYNFVCNLTAENYGLPWYCGKPSHRNLLCHDFRGLACLGKPGTRLTSHEEKFFDKRLLHQMIPDILQIKVISDELFVPLPPIPCNKSPLRQSWEASSPVGFFYKNQWKSLTCNNTVPADPQIYRKCLKDRTLWLHGDSTSRHWLLNFKDRLEMQFASQAWRHEKWHKPTVLFSEEWNTRILFVPHEYPVYYGDEMLNPLLNRATHTYLDALPSHSRDIFVIHLYLHFNPSSPDYFRFHVRRIVKSVKSLVSRAPDIKLAVRGAHAFKGLSALGFLDDIWMITYNKILKEEFGDLQDKVLFLNNADLTIVKERDDPHPLQVALNPLIEHFMGSICDS